jgi:ribosome recycling factor
VIEETLLETIEKMGKAVEHAQNQFATVRTGRATPALVERLMVNYYGSDVPLQQLAGFSVPEARTLVIKPHDRGAMTAIEKAIRDSDLGMSPSSDGVVIRLNVPALTEERRRDYVKIVKNMAESLGVPTATSTREIPVKVLEENRHAINRHQQGLYLPKVSFTHLIAWAMVQAIARVPAMAAQFVDQDGKPFRRLGRSLNIGIAVDLPAPAGSRDGRRSPRHRPFPRLLR